LFKVTRMNDRLCLLGQRIADAIGGRGRASEFERYSGGVFTRMTLQRWIDGKTFPDVAELQGFADLVKRPLSWFLDISEVNPDQRMVSIELLNAEAAAGAARYIDAVTAIDEFSFPLPWLEKLGGAPGHVQAMRAVGNSMEPTISNRALLLVDNREQNKKPCIYKEPSRKIDNRSQYLKGIYVFVQNGGLRIKRLYILPKPTGFNNHFWIAVSDNLAEHPPEIFEQGGPETATVIGRVIWWDNRL
jgi:phage repressor protein C with HTH and peptisase S24 domain